MTSPGNSKEMFWRKALRRCAESGLSQADFCKREKLNPNNLSHWKREIALRDATRPTSEKASDPDQRLSYWRSVIAHFNTSGLSKDDFCTREGIKPMAFTWWRAELMRRDTANSKAVAQPLDLFVPLKVSQEKSPLPMAAHQAIAEIDMSTGTMRILNTHDTAALVALLKAFKESAV